MYNLLYLLIETQHEACSCFQWKLQYWIVLGLENLPKHAIHSPMRLQSQEVDLEMHIS